MKFFTGSLAAGLVASGGRRAGAGARALHGGIGCRGPLCDAPRAPVPPPHFEPGPRYGYGPQPAAVDGSLLRAARQRLLAARHPQAARLRLHHRGDRPRRRGRPAGHRRAQRPDPPLHAGLPHGRRQFYEEQSALRGPLERSRRRPSRRSPRRIRSRPRRARHGRPGCEPRGADAEGQSARRQACDRPHRRRSSRRPRLRRAPKSAEAQAVAPAPSTTGCGPAKPAPSIAPTGGDAEGAGAGVNSTVFPARRRRQQKNAPVSRGVFAFSQYRPKAWICVTRRPRRRPPAGLARRS